MNSDKEKQKQPAVKPKDDASIGVRSNSFHVRSHSVSGSVNIDETSRNIKTTNNSERSIEKHLDKIADPTSKNVTNFVANEASLPKVAIVRSESDKAKSLDKDRKHGSYQAINKKQEPVHSSHSAPAIVSMVDDPLECMNILLNTYDFQTVQHSLQTCQIVCSQLLDLQHTLNLLKYCVLTDEYDDSIELAKKCTQQLRLMHSKRSHGLIKILNDAHQDIMDKIKKRLVDNFSVVNAGTTHNGGGSGQNNAQTERIVKMLELLGEDEMSRFLYEIARKICESVPRDPFSRSSDQTTAWIGKIMHDDQTYAPLVHHGIKMYILACWCDIVKDTIKADNAVLITRGMFMNFKRTYREMLIEYVQKHHLSSTASNSKKAPFVADSLDPMCERLVNEINIKFSETINASNRRGSTVMEALDPVCERTINEINTKFSATIDGFFKLETIETLSENTDNLFIAIKDFEKTVSNYKNPRNEKIVLGIYAKIFERYFTEIRVFISKTNSYKSTDLKIIHENFVKAFGLIRQIENSYNIKLLTSTSSFLTDVKSEGADLNPDSNMRQHVSTNSLQTFENSIEEVIKALNRDVYEKYRAQIIELLESTMLRHRSDGTINSVIRRGINLLSNDKGSEKDKNIAFASTLDVSEQIPKITTMLNDVGGYDENIKMYLITDVLVWYKDLIDINNLYAIRSTAFRQIIMDVYQIRTNVRIQNTIFAEVEGKAKFLSGDIIKDELFVEMFNTFYPVSQVEKLKVLAKYKGCSDDKINNLVRIFKTVSSVKEDSRLRSNESKSTTANQQNVKLPK